MDYKKRYAKVETRKKYADMLIAVGEKFYFSAIMAPMAIFIKSPINLSSTIFAFIIVLTLGMCGIVFQRYGLKIYDIESKE